MAWSAAAQAAACPRDGVLGTSRILHVDAATTPRVGLKQYPQTSPLWDHAPGQELKLIIDRLKTAGRGIILFHDPKARTAAMLPAFLRYLRDNRYRVVHLVPTGPGVGFDGVP